jgi:hypothetical protein
LAKFLPAESDVRANELYATNAGVQSMARAVLRARQHTPNGSFCIFSFLNSQQQNLMASGVTAGQGGQPNQYGLVGPKTVVPGQISMAKPPVGGRTARASATANPKPNIFVTNAELEIGAQKNSLMRIEDEMTELKEKIEQKNRSPPPRDRFN